MPHQAKQQLRITTNHAGQPILLNLLVLPIINLY